jgi:hypothetical protein
MEKILERLLIAFYKIIKQRVAGEMALPTNCVVIIAESLEALGTDFQDFLVVVFLNNLTDVSQESIKVLERS